MSQIFDPIDDLLEQCINAKISRTDLQNRVYDQFINNLSLSKEDQDYADWLNQKLNSGTIDLNSLSRSAWKAGGTANPNPNVPLDPRNNDIRILLSSGQYDKAWQKLEVWLRSNPDDDAGITLLEELVNLDSNRKVEAEKLLSNLESLLSPNGKTLLLGWSRQIQIHQRNTQSGVFTTNGGTATGASINPIFHIANPNSNDPTHNATSSSTTGTVNMSSHSTTITGLYPSRTGDPWADYKDAVARGNLDEARYWLSQVPANHSQYNSVDTARKTLDDKDFYNRQPILLMLPVRLISARNRRNWTEFEKLYNEAEKLLDNKDKLPESIQELMRKVSDSKDAEEITKQARERRERGEYDNALSLANNALGLDDRFGEATDERTQANRSKSLFEGLRETQRKSKLTKDELLTALESARELYQEISPRSAEAQRLYDYFQRDAWLPSELAEIKARTSLKAADILQAESLLDELEPKLPQNNNLSAFRREINTSKAQLQKAIRAKADTALTTLDRPNSSLIERNKACTDIETCIGELEHLESKDDSVVELQTKLTEKRSLLNEALHRQQEITNQINALKTQQQNNQPVLPSNVEKIVPELAKIYQYAPSDYSLTQQTGDLVGIVSIEINKLTGVNYHEIQDMDTARQLLNIIQELPSPDSYRASVQKSQNSIEAGIRGAVYFWLNQGGIWDTYQLALNNALGLINLARNLSFINPSVVNGWLEDARNTCINRVRNQLDFGVMNQTSLNEANKVAVFQQSVLPSGNVNLRQEIIGACIRRVQALLEEARHHTAPKDARAKIEEAEELRSHALSIYPNETDLIQLGLQVKKARTEQSRRSLFLRGWRPALVATLTIVVIVVFVLATNNYWETWKVAVLGYTPTPIPPPTATITPLPPTVTPLPPPISLQPDYYCVPETQNTNLTHYYSGCHNIINDNNVTMKDFWQNNQKWLGQPITEALLDSTTNNTSQYFENGLVEYKPKELSSDGTHFFLFLVGNELASCYSGVDFTNLKNNIVYDKCLDPTTKQPIYKSLKAAPIDPDFVKNLKAAAQPVNAAPTDGDCIFVNLRSHNVCNDHGFRAIFENNGIAYMGVPITEEFSGIYKTRPVTIQFFERAILIYDAGANNGQAYLLPIGITFLEDVDGSKVVLNAFGPSVTPTPTTTPVMTGNTSIRSGTLTVATPTP